MQLYTLQSSLSREGLTVLSNTSEARRRKKQTIPVSLYHLMVSAYSKQAAAEVSRHPAVF